MKKRVLGALDGHQACLGLIVVLGVGLRLWGVDFGLPHTQCRPDESTLVNKALGIGTGDLNPHFFNYPTLHFYLLAGLYGAYFCGGVLVGHFADLAAFGRQFFVDPTAFFLLGRLLGVALGSASILLVYGIGCNAGGRRVGLLGAFFVATAFLHVRDSHFATVDVPATCYVLGALVCLGRFIRQRRRADWLWAAVLLGLGVSTKYNVVFFAAALLPAVQGVEHRLRHLALAAGLAMAAFLAGTPFALLDFATFWRDISFERQHFSLGHGIDLGLGWGYHLGFSLLQGLGLPLLAAGLAAAVWVGWRRSPQTSMLLLAGGAYYLGAGAGHTVFMRYMVPLVPVVCLLAAYGLNQVGRRWHGVWLALAAVVLAAPSLAKDWNHDALLARPDTRLLAAAWIQTHIPSGAGLAMAGSPYGYPPLYRSDAWLRRRLEDVRQGGLPGRRLERMLALADYPPQPNYDIVELRPPEALALRSVQPAATVDALLDQGVEWVLVHEHPLAYSRPHAPLVAELVARAAPVAHFVGIAAGAAAVFDPIDAYYVPVAGFAEVLRPGPNITIYRLKRASD